MLVYQTVDKNEIHVFTRDLSERVNVNLKHKIEDYDKQSQTATPQKTKGKKGKQPKKKDLIIAEQTKKRYEKNRELDKQRIQGYMKRNEFSLSSMMSFLNLLITQEEKNHFQFLMLAQFWSQKPKPMEKVLSLFFQLQGKTQTPDDVSLLSKIESKINGYEYNLYMLKHLGHQLPPLNYWEQKFVFDDWQIKAIQTIRHRNSLIVKAPTSSGKSLIGYSAAVFHKRILYLCPSEPVAYQVGSHFIKMNKKVHFLLDNIGHFGYDDKCNVFVGTPTYVEDYLYRIELRFDYAVFDEIHELDHSYENLIKVIECPFLALSATISNTEDIVTLFKNIHPKQTIHTITYGKRFINMQRWVWTDNILRKIHPLACFTTPQEILDIDLKMTPNDVAMLWEAIETEFDRFDYDQEFDIHDSLEDYIETLSPDSYFQSNQTLLSLDKVQVYESFLKSQLVYLNSFFPDQIRAIFQSFHFKVNYQPGLIDCLNQCKQKSMFPMLMFNTSDDVCSKIFTQLYEDLVRLETDHHPYHYQLLEKKQAFYLQYNQRRKQLSQTLIPPRNSDPNDFLKTKLDQFDRDQMSTYVQLMIDYYQTLKERVEESDKSAKLKQIQIENLDKGLAQFMKSPDLTYQDVYQKHPDYCYNISEPMSGAKIKEIRAEISQSLGFSIPYEHPMFQMLKRGIGLYIESSPERYRRLLQTLLIHKDIGVVISGKSLSTGIDMPIKSSCILGHEETTLTTSDFLQMSGRAGRRGHDTSGNVLFYNVDYETLVKGGLPKVEGSQTPIYTHYRCLPQINLEPVFHNFLNSKRICIQTPNYVTKSTTESRLIWKLRDYPTYHEFMIRFQIPFQTSHPQDQLRELFDTCLLLFPEDSDSLLTCWKQTNYHHLYPRLIQVVIDLYNHQKSKRDRLLELFEQLKRMITKQNGFQLI